MNNYGMETNYHNKESVNKKNVITSDNILLITEK